MAKLEVPIVVDVDAIREYLEQNDIVEVVRCRDCKRSTVAQSDANGFIIKYWCNRPTIVEMVPPNHYCSFGKRRN